jgi:hypothetical protein
MFEGAVDLVVHDGGERACRAEVSGSRADANPGRPERVRVDERVEEHVGRRADGQLPTWAD